MEHIEFRSKSTIPWWVSLLILVSSLTLLLYSARLCGQGAKAARQMEQMAKE